MSQTIKECCRLCEDSVPNGCTQPNCKCHQPQAELVKATEDTLDQYQETFKALAEHDKNPECKKCGLLKSTVEATGTSCARDRGEHDFGENKRVDNLVDNENQEEKIMPNWTDEENYQLSQKLKMLNLSQEEKTTTEIELGKIFDSTNNKAELAIKVASLLSSERQRMVEQKHYELAMQIQAIDFFLSKDEEEYGSTALHGKLRAFLSSLLTDKEELKEK